MVLDAGALALTYDPSCDAWVLDLEPMALRTMSPTSTSDDPRAPAKGGDKGARRRGLARCWELIRERFAECLVCYRPAAAAAAAGESTGCTRSGPPRQYGYYSQMSMRDRDEKLNEAIMYCKKTMRREPPGCHQAGCMRRRSCRSASC